MKEAQTEFQETTDPFTVWANEHLYVGTDPKTGEVKWTPAQRIITALNKHQTREHRPTIAETRFGLQMRRLYPKMEPVKKTVTLHGEKKEVRCWPLSLDEGADY
jgi:hypothetical protein